MYEKALQDCGYAGTAMYWDWVADSSAPTKAAVFNPVLGFGGNGNGTADNGGHPRVRDGAFTSLRPTYWGTTVEPHWLSRDWQSSDGTPGVPPDMYSNAWNPEAMEYVNSQTLYDEFRRALESSPHASVHAGVGGPRGDMGLHDASPNGEWSFALEAKESC